MGAGGTVVAVRARVVRLRVAEGPAVDGAVAVRARAKRVRVAVGAAVDGAVASEVDVFPIGLLCRCPEAEKGAKGEGGARVAVGAEPRRLPRRGSDRGADAAAAPPGEKVAAATRSLITPARELSAW